MISTGNDIVSFDAIDVTRTKQAKFYSKILTANELSLYQDLETSIPFEHFVWLLWSIKESAYKYLQRHQPALIFTPVKFLVDELKVPSKTDSVCFTPTQITSTGFDDQDVIKAVVRYDTTVLHSCSLLYQQLLISVVNEHEDFSNISLGVKQIADSDPQLQSAQVRNFLLEQLAASDRSNEFVIKKNDKGCPLVFKRDIETDVIISLAHHGRFVGYSMVNNTKQNQPAP